MEHIEKGQPPRLALGQRAEELWAQDDAKRRSGIELLAEGPRAQVLDMVAAMICFANEFRLLHTIVPDPNNRWWRRRHMVVMFVIWGTNQELIQFLNVLSEDPSTNAG